MTNTGIATSVATIIGAALLTFGISIDPSLVSNAVQGVVAIVTLGAALWSAYEHYKVANK